jgi:hypothetical protein
MVKTAAKNWMNYKDKRRLNDELTDDEDVT